jgi:hypothetical protein
MQNKVIPFVGSGVSMAVLNRETDNSLFPDWNELLHKAIERLGQEGKSSAACDVESFLNSRDNLKAAQIAKDKLGPIWYSFLKEQLDISNDKVLDYSLELAREIWRIGSQLIITTNFDKVLHWTCPKHDGIVKTRNHRINN